MLKLLLLFAAAVVALPTFLATAAIPETPAATKAVTLVRATQQADGGFGGFGPGQTWDAVFALRAAGYDPKVAAASGKSTLDFLKATAPSQTKPPAAAKAALAARALGADPRAVGTTNLIAVVSGGLNTTTGKFADDDFSQAISMLGLGCTGNTVPAAAITALKQGQLADGGWGFGGASDADTTAIALQALVASGVSSTDASVTMAVARLKAMQGADAGWGFDPSSSNASSTAYVIQALIAAGEQPDAATYAKGGKTPVGFLLNQQQADGSFTGFDATYAAMQAIPALMGRTFCNAADTPITKPALPALVPALATPTPAGLPPSTAPPATPGSAPLPPATGTGANAPNSQSGGWILVAGTVAVATSAFALTRSRRR